ncbi:MAG: rRNA maturation RNase YbeY [Flavobacteriaceae bacterium]|nr:rRNA maturation RNase YbeY [Flavobacteriaceae bacterium]NVJ72653.1 rRNA maturation RNase YbeY [Flavobacteriaceae bacterium]
MIEYSYNTDFDLTQADEISLWLQNVAKSENFEIADLNYVFVSDEELYEMNVKYLNHNTLTDIITFNYVENEIVSGDIFISVDRVKENAVVFNVSFENELLRVMVHGLLHLMNYNDKTDEEQELMTLKEDEKLKMFHVEH